MGDDFDRDTFLAERRDVLLSLDVGKMRAYMRKYGERVPASDEVCMIAMHKARCEATDIPTAEKVKSRFWLKARGYKAGL